MSPPIRGPTIRLAVITVIKSTIPCALSSIVFFSQQYEILVIVCFVIIKSLCITPVLIIAWGHFALEKHRSITTQTI